jgi:hypothetical protein
MRYLLLAFLLLPAVQASATGAGDPPGDVLVLPFPDAPALAGYDEGRLLVRVMWDDEAGQAAWMDLLRVSYLVGDSVAYYRLNEAIEHPAAEGPMVFAASEAEVSAALGTLQSHAAQIAAFAAGRAGAARPGRPLVISVTLRPAQ